jgi:inorganic pyrophosphatase
MKVVTAGAGYLDIDAYAGCVAYAELLNLQGEAAVAASTATWNESITPTIRSWNAALETGYTFHDDDTFAIVDTSDPQFFDSFVDVGKIVEIIDHHPEFETYWQERLGEKAHIEFIGAACTLVFERWQQAGLLERISATSARLLTAGILDNTLNFQASVTTQRDKDAYAELMKHADLSADWPAQYFSECQQTVLKDVASALKNDTKTMNFPSLGHQIRVGQLVVWDAAEIVANQLRAIQETIETSGNEWFVNIVSIREGKCYFVAANKTVQGFLHGSLDVTFRGAVGVSERLWLRKEIMKRDMELNQT